MGMVYPRDRVTITIWCAVAGLAFVTSCAGGSRATAQSQVSRGHGHNSSTLRHSTAKTAGASKPKAPKSTEASGPKTPQSSGPSGGDPASFACSATSTYGSASNQEVSSGNVQLQLSQTLGVGPGTFEASLVLDESGATIYSSAVVPVVRSTSQNAQVWSYVSQVCLEVQKSGGPVIYLVGYSTGASCCSIVRAYYPENANTYGYTDLVTQSAKVVNLYGDIVVTGADIRFQCRFGPDCAESGMPVAIYQFEDAQFVLVTQGFPVQLREDALKWWNLVQHPQATDSQGPGTITGFIAPWVADECGLGLTSSAFSTLQTMSSQGNFRGDPNFVVNLETYLQANGYCNK